MSKSSSRLILRYLHHNRISTSSPPFTTEPNSTTTAISHFLPYQPKVHSPITPWLSNTQRNYVSSPISKTFQYPIPKLNPQLLNGNVKGFRHFSDKGLDVDGKIYGNFMKNVVEKPVSAAKSSFSRYREAVGLRIEAFWKRNSLLLIGAGGVVVCILLWRVMFTFIGLSEGMAEYGFLALSTAIVAFAIVIAVPLCCSVMFHGLYLRSRFTINPDKVYRMAMRRLNTSAGILEVMGAPLTGTDLRAYVTSGGGITVENFKAGLRGKLCFLVFPIRGSERKGLVSVEVKNKKGQVCFVLATLCSSYDAAIN